MKRMLMLVATIATVFLIAACAYSPSELEQIEPNQKPVERGDLMPTQAQGESQRSRHHQATGP